MENVFNRRNIEMVTNKKDFQKLASKRTFKDFCHLEELNPDIQEGVTLVEMGKSKIFLNKPIYVGQTILDNSKLLTYKFHYDYIKKKYPGDKSQLLATDTDGLIYHIKTEDVYEDIRPDVEKHFDTSNFPSDHPAKLPRVNKKVPGLMKDETAGKEILGFSGTSSKQYAYIFENEEEVKKNKGIKKSVVKKDLRFEDYKRAVLEGKEMSVRMNAIRSHNHILFSESQKKKAFRTKDDKRIVLEDKVSTVPLGYKK